jgi:hypothetical protein
MIIHCEINKKNDLKLKSFEKAYKVEYIYRGYWAKWYSSVDTKNAKEQFKIDFPDGIYCRIKK